LSRSSPSRGIDGSRLPLRRNCCIVPFRQLCTETKLLFQPIGQPGHARIAASASPRRVDSWVSRIRPDPFGACSRARLRRPDEIGQRRQNVGENTPFRCEPSFASGCHCDCQDFARAAASSIVLANRYKPGCALQSRLISSSSPRCINRWNRRSKRDPLIRWNRRSKRTQPQTYAVATCTPRCISGLSDKVGLPVVVTGFVLDYAESDAFGFLHGAQANRRKPAQAWHVHP
jgi:hypothetical protein